MAKSTGGVISLSHADRRNIHSDIDSVIRYLERPSSDDGQSLQELRAAVVYIGAPELKACVLGELLLKPLERIPDDAPQDARDSAGRLLDWLRQQHGL